MGGALQECGCSLPPAPSGRDPAIHRDPASQVSEGAAHLLKYYLNAVKFSLFGVQVTEFEQARIIV